LLHYLYKILEEKFPGTEDLRAELGHIESASKTNLNSLLAEVHELRNGLKVIDNELDHHKTPKSGDNFFNVMNVLFCFSKIIRFLIFFKKK